MLAEVQARLTAQVPALKHVAGAAEFAALQANPPKHLQPAAYVIPLADTAGDNQAATGATIQRVTERFAALLALGNLGDARGEAATEAMEAIRAAVRDALVAWAPTADHSQALFAGGRIIGLRDAVVWWQDDFRADSTIRKP